MRKREKTVKRISMLLVVALVCSFLAGVGTEAAAKLTAKDFKAKNTWWNNYIKHCSTMSKEEKKNGRDSIEFYNGEKKKDVPTTNRNIKIHYSNLKGVTKAYGKTKVYNWKKKKDVVYQSHCVHGAMDKEVFDNVKKYAEYTYKKNNDEVYRIRFYFDKKNKVEAIAYSLN